MILLSLALLITIAVITIPIVLGVIGWRALYLGAVANGEEEN